MKRIIAFFLFIAFLRLLPASPRGADAARPTPTSPVEFDAAAYFLDGAAAMFAESVQLRRQLHRMPELCFQEKETSAFVAAYLKKLGLEVSTGIAGTGIKAVLRGGRPGAVVGLRADMDALPIVEATGLPFASQRPGRMHACGHDAHMTHVLAAAKLLAAVRDRLAGTVVFIFQPCEEGAPMKETGGAERLIAAGILENPRLDALFGLHVLPDLPAGKIALRPGAIMANVSWIYVRIQGKAAHGAFPHQGIDAIFAAAQAVNQFQALISRYKDPGEKAVLTIGRINGGVRSNVIAESVEMEGTVRTFSDELENRIRLGMENILRGLETSLGVKTSLDFEKVNPAVMNDAGLHDLVLPVFRRALGKANVLTAEPLTIGEDFSLYSRRLPSLFFFLGSGVGNALHSPAFTVDEGILKVAPALLAAAAFVYLETKAGQ
ncbi:MAG: M20 family metallopeptidase [Acidobacteria bacterium]|jgi:amidohydrolase|nr:M20 family metallopeptidase [Acidobacteriota bacterium]